MKLLRKIFVAVVLLLCIGMFLTSCNFPLEIVGQLPADGRCPCYFADSVWRTDDGKLTIYGTGNGETATGIYADGGKTVELYIRFDQFSSADIYDYSAKHIDRIDGDSLYESWSVDYINYDYHGFLEIERDRAVDFANPKLNGLFPDDKPLKLRPVKGETIPEIEMVEEGENYRIFKNNLSLFGYKVFDGNGKTVLSGFAPEKPTVEMTGDHLLDFEIPDFELRYHKLYDPLKNRLSINFNYKIADLSGDYIAYLDDANCLSIEEIFGQSEYYYDPLDFLKKGDTVTGLKLRPDKKTVDVVYHSAKSGETKTQIIRYKLTKIDTY